jgi:hypothetical protein
MNRINVLEKDFTFDEILIFCFRKRILFLIFVILLNFFNCLKRRFTYSRLTLRLNIKISNASKFSASFDSFCIRFVTFRITFIWLELANRWLNSFCMIFFSNKTSTIDWLSTLRWRLKDANMLFFFKSQRIVIFFLKKN